MSEPEVVLTASPLQRVGAFALAALAEVNHPAELSRDGLDKVVDGMTDHLLSTVKVAKAADAGGFWLSASYFLWPNSGLNPTARGKQPKEKRHELISDWRKIRESGDVLDVPCAYCGRPACDWFGKVDIPLGASVAHRNTTAPGHEGTPLCFPCLASLWAFPYGAQLTGGRAAVMHSWDDAFLASMTRIQVSRTLRAAEAEPVKTKKKAPWYARELWVWDAVRNYGSSITAGVELIVSSNSNQEQLLVTQELTQPIAEWARSTVRYRAGYAALVAAHTTKEASGENNLARRAFTEPQRVVTTAIAHLVARVAADGAVPAADVKALQPLILSYCKKVLTMDDKDVLRIQDLAARLAGLLGQDDRPGPFRDFIRANGKGGNLHAWFRSRGVDWLLYPKPDDAAPVLLPVPDYRLLFEDERSWAWRRLLVFAVLEKLGEAGWQPRGSKEELEEFKEDIASVDEGAEQ